MQLPFVVVNAFVSDGTGGNGAGVVIEDDLAPELAAALEVDGQRCAVAANVGLSETAFVRLPPSPGEPISIRYFTPTEEVPLCGHATVATVSHLQTLKHIPTDVASVNISTGAGVLPVWIDRQAGTVSLTQSLPDFSRPPIPLQAVTSSLGLSTGDVVVDPPAAPVSTGLFDVCVRVRNAEVLRKLVPDFPKMAQVSTQFEVCGFHVYALLDDSEDTFNGADIYARNFAPAVGIDEESATGTSNGALCSLLWRSGVVSRERRTLVVAQGDFMNPPAPSRITVQVLDGVPGVAAPTVGGCSAFMQSGHVEMSATTGSCNL